MEEFHVTTKHDYCVFFSLHTIHVLADSIKHYEQYLTYRYFSYSDFYLFIVGAESHCCVGLHSKTHTHSLTNTHTHSVGVLSRGDRAVAKTSTWQHTALTRDRYPCLRKDSNPHSQQSSGCRSVP